MAHQQHLDTSFCLEALHGALLQYPAPTIFNTDQGSQYTSDLFTGALIQEGIKVSMDGKGRATDNAFIERLWRSVKQQCVYRHSPADGNELRAFWPSTSPITTTNDHTSTWMD
ncbi:MAG: transposase family protein [Flavobacteriales bacterium]|nr:transposase family protein [Flavobacteriales bacterium]